MVGPRRLRPYQPLALRPCRNGTEGYPAGGCEVAVWFAPWPGNGISEPGAVCLRGLQTVCHHPPTEERGGWRPPSRGQGGDQGKGCGWLSQPIRTSRRGIGIRPDSASTQPATHQSARCPRGHRPSIGAGTQSPNHSLPGRYPYSSGNSQYRTTHADNTMPIPLNTNGIPDTPTPLRNAMA